MDLKIVTWNILHPDHVGVYDIEEKYLTWEYRKPLILERLLAYNADVYCLQEVDSSLIDDFKLDGYTLVWQDDKARTKKLLKWREVGGKKPNTLVCVTLVKELFKVLSWVVGSRCLTVTISGLEHQFIITNVHLEAGKGMDDLHIKHLSKVLNSNIICGDFNDFIGEPAMNFMDKHFNTVYLKKRPKATFIHGAKVWVVDYIYYGKGLQLKDVEWVEMTGVSKTHSSDHSPVYAELTQN